MFLLCLCGKKYFNQQQPSSFLIHPYIIHFKTVREHRCTPPLLFYAVLLVTCSTHQRGHNEHKRGMKNTTLRKPFCALPRCILTVVWYKIAAQVNEEIYVCPFAVARKIPAKKLIPTRYRKARLMGNCFSEGWFCKIPALQNLPPVPAVRHAWRKTPESRIAKPPSGCRGLVSPVFVPRPRRK